MTNTTEDYSFPVPDFFESFEELTIPKILKRLNNFDTSFLQVDQITGAEQITVKHMYAITDNAIVGRKVIFSMPGRMETPAQEELKKMAVAAGWNWLTITEHSFGFNSYTKFYLSRKF